MRDDGLDQQADATADAVEPDQQVAAAAPAAGDLSTLKAQANLAQSENRLEEAERLWQEVLSHDAREGEALCGVALCLLSADRGADARPYVARVVAADVIHYQPWVNLGSRLREVHRYAESVDVFRSLARGYPGQADVWHHLGLAELSARWFAPALASLLRASRMQPTSCAVWCNLILVLMGLNRLPDALAAAHRALAIEPTSGVATFSISAVLLAMGRLREGFAAYENRFALGGTTWMRHDIGALPWTGEALAGRSILVVGEQANGDHIQFARYVSELCRRGANVTYTLPARLHRLMRVLEGDVTLAEQPDPAQHYDFQVALLSLPHYLQVEEGRMLSTSPYLAAETDRVAAWRERIGRHDFRIGVAWQGNRYPDGNDFERSFPLEALWPVARVPGVRLISLQLSDGLDQLSRLPPGMTVEMPGEGYDAGEHAFLDTAAVMASLDLVITLDSAIAHLAGALARPTWLALPFAPEWRWQRDRSDTPWYPTMRLFRQAVPGDWDGVFERMAEALPSLTGRSLQASPAPPPDLPLVPASCGEVLDKISILEIKVERLQPAAAAASEFELRLLRSALRGFGTLDEEVDARFADLRRVNRSLWDVEDRLRLHEAEQRFDDDFVALARSVYALNDERARIKRRINVGLDSAIVEHKSYGEAAPAASMPS